MSAVVEARGVVKAYGRTVALHGVDLTVGAGELVGLLGPNGAGKSTLVKVCCGLVRPTAGTATVAGAPAGSPPARARRWCSARTSSALAQPGKRKSSAR